MLYKVALFIVISILYGCASQPTHTSYRELFLENDFAFEQYSPQFYQEAKLHCPDMMRDLEELQAKLHIAEASGDEITSKKLRKEIKWLKGWISIVDCEYNHSSSRDKNHDKATMQESKTGDTQSGLSSTRDDTPPTVPHLSFDVCFTKCKELTSRTNEECFDTCIKR